MFTSEILVANESLLFGSSNGVFGLLKHLCFCGDEVFEKGIVSKYFIVRLVLCLAKNKEIEEFQELNHVILWLNLRNRNRENKRTQMGVEE